MAKYKTKTVSALNKLWEEELQIKLNTAMEDLPAMQRLIFRYLPKFIDIDTLLERLDNDPKAREEIKRQLERILKLFEEDRETEVPKELKDEHANL